MATGLNDAEIPENPQGDTIEMRYHDNDTYLPMSTYYSIQEPRYKDDRNEQYRNAFVSPYAVNRVANDSNVHFTRNDNPVNSMRSTPSYYQRMPQNNDRMMKYAMPRMMENDKILYSTGSKMQDTNDIRSKSPPISERIPEPKDSKNSQSSGFRAINTEMDCYDYGPEGEYITSRGRDVSQSAPEIPFAYQQTPFMACDYNRRLPTTKESSEEGEYPYFYMSGDNYAFMDLSNPLYNERGSGNPYMDSAMIGGIVEDSSLRYSGAQSSEYSLSHRNSGKGHYREKGVYPKQDDYYMGEQGVESSYYPREEELNHWRMRSTSLHSNSSTKGKHGNAKRNKKRVRGTPRPSKNEMKNMGGMNSERSAEEITMNIASIRKEIDNNRGSLLNMALTQNGCKQLQQALDVEGIPIVEILYEEIESQMNHLMVNPFGNYLFQKIIELSSDQQKLMLLRYVKQHLRTASKDTHGTRCVQKLIQLCRQPEMVEIILDSLCPYVVELSADVNGNHVIKRCISGIDSGYKERLINEIIAHCIEISKAVYGCCVVQKCIDVADGKQHKELLDVIEEHSVELMKDLYANYVIQYLIKNAPTEESNRFCRCVIGHVVELSKQKCSSNVVEIALKGGNETIRVSIIEELIKSPSIKDLLMDSFGNYVIQKAFTLSEGSQRERLIDVILQYQDDLRNNKTGRYVLSRVQNCRR